MSPLKVNVACGPNLIVGADRVNLDLLLDAYNSGDMLRFAIEQPHEYAVVQSEALRLGYLMFGSMGPQSTWDHYEGHQIIYNKASVNHRQLKQAACAWTPQQVRHPTR